MLLSCLLELNHKSFLADPGFCHDILYLRTLIEAYSSLSKFLLKTITLFSLQYALSSLQEVKKMVKMSGEKENGRHKQAHHALEEVYIQSDHLF